ncbi:MAG: methyltransferase domain-containing protein [Acidimicrobiia bacterium]|nr:methyltransferase domain-containing protein [Acidimicrobiia bacterium]
MLTADYERLGLGPGDMLLDIGAGFGRHAFEAFRRGATPVACDLGLEELVSCRATFAAMAGSGEAPSGATAAVVQGSTLSLPFTDGAFDRVIASEVLEHVVEDGPALGELHRVLRPGGTLAVTVPAWLPETVCWRLDDDYHAPVAVGGHVRIYSRTVLRARLEAAGFRPGRSHHAHGLHTPYWWLRCAVGVDKGPEDHPLVRAYHRLLVWDIAKGPRTTRLAERALNPVLGKSLVMYATKPVGERTSTRVAA